MVWCSYCEKNQQAERDDINGFTCCTGCGRVLDDNVYGSDPTFTKTAAGQSQVEGNFVKDGQSSSGRLGAGAGRILGYQSDSHEKTLAKGKHEIVDILERLAIRPRDDMATQAHRFYTIALERNFTRGRRTQQVAASCIYIVCRQNNKPYMLIDFSDCLQTNVYVLGAVFLQLSNLLRLEEQPFMQKPVDPSLFIHRFADRLQFGKKMHAVANTSLRLVASMKRDWMQTGRRPSGICGAALFISAHMHGFERSKSDVVSVVHICEATLKKRLVEFECTESGSLTEAEVIADFQSDKLLNNMPEAEEFEIKGQEMESQIRAAVHEASITGSQFITEIMCEHKDTGVVHFSHGLCRMCYEEFVRVSGGMQGGSAPPAFQRAELQRMEAVREQLKGQGLDSDEEDENGIPIKKVKGAGNRVPSAGKAVDPLPSVEANFANLLPPSGKRRGEMKSKDEVAKMQGSVPICCTDGIGRRWARLRGKGRGRADSDAAGSGHENDLEEIGDDMDDEKIRGKGRGRVISEVSQCALSGAETSDSAEVLVGRNRADEETLNAPGDDDVLRPTKVQPRRRSVESRVSSGCHRAEEVQDTELENLEETVGNGCKINELEARAVRSPIPFSTGSGDNTKGTKLTDSQVDNIDVEVPESLNTVTESRQSAQTVISGEQQASDGRIDEDVLDDDTLSDIDDEELVGYMNNEEEIRLKTIIWTEMNKEYLQEQEAKRVALASMEAARAAAFAAAASNSSSAAELAAAAAAAVAQMRKDRKQKRIDDAKRPPAQSAAEATRQMLESKRLSTKVDYTVLAKLFDTDESDDQVHARKSKQDEDADSEAITRSGKRTRFGSQGDGSQTDSVITQISARRSLMREVDSKEGSVSVVDMNEEDKGEVDDEDDGMAEDGELEVEGLPYEYDEADDYYEEY